MGKVSPVAPESVDEGAVDNGGASDRGPRPDNQDRYRVTPDLAILSDGMGGYEGGARAAELSVEAAARTLGAASPSARDGSLVQRAFVAANGDVRGERVGRLQHMGATLSIAMALAGHDDVCRGDRWLIAHAGDSPVFVVRGAEATPVTTDHTVPGQLVQQGLLSEADAVVHPYRHVLLRGIGVEETLEADLREVSLERGDAIVLVSDGVSDVLSPDEIATSVWAPESATSAARALIDDAVARGTHDNVTAVVLRYMASSTRARPVG